MSRTFLAGVVEGFYGPPWTQAERFELFDWMAAWGLDTYVYAPKDDLHHRTLWRDPYGASDLQALGDLIAACRGRGLRFLYGLSPGLDMRYGSEPELIHLYQRADQMLGAGCEHFAILFDDVPDRLEGEDLARFGGLAPAQVHAANALFTWIRARRPEACFLFCPTAYCGRMAAAGLGGEGYLAAVGRGLLQGIDVLWTGPEIVSRELSVAHVRDVQAMLGRKPIIWDNLHANDYDGRRFFCGPYAGRPAALRGEVGGLLSNPNTEFVLNYVPIRTLAQYVRAEGAWEARDAWLAAMAEWLPHFDTVATPVALEDLILFGDCYYLPHEEGPGAQALHERVRSLLARSPAAWGEDAAVFRAEAHRLRTFCARMADLRRRSLFHAISRRVWELREELDLLQHYVALKSASADADPPVRSEFHLPGTYRGGIVARLQAMLVQQPDGTFVPADGVRSVTGDQ